MSNYRYRRNRGMYTAGSSAVAATYVIDEHFVQPGDELFAAYEQDMDEAYRTMSQSQEINPDVSIDYARSEGVEHAWEMNSFWASEDVNAPDQVFQYTNDEGNIVYFSENEQDLMRDWQPGDKAPIEGMEGHHLQTVRENPNNTELAADSSNIMFATEEGHREHLHGGDTHNPTDPLYMEAALSNDQKYDMTIAHNEDVLTMDSFEFAAATVTTSVIASMTISQLIRLHELKKDARPWSMKKRDLAEGLLPDLAKGSMIAAGVWMTSEAVSSLSAGFLAETSASFLTDILAVNASFFAVSFIFAAKDYWAKRNQPGLSEEAKNQFKAKMLEATAELIGFTALGVAFEFGLGMLGDLAADALIPDPTGLLVVGRMLWSGFKLFSKHKEKQANIQAYNSCHTERMNHLEQQARLSLN
ncbi:hypothetical protein LCM20_12255 [Halobacillus litoralis]|uniref:hypothetical protein n=1 Tax=Halobacillus litoralis TaxID=45668 RepID=UPI001CD4A078|nr:hypothetical protein [Halobacillus litoralis]MCA0971369.1 hypothetical protein [Halobacillus litoralis]